MARSVDNEDTVDPIELQAQEQYNWIERRFSIKKGTRTTGPLLDASTALFNATAHELDSLLPSTEEAKAVLVQLHTVYLAAQSAIASAPAKAFK
jgi:hypothetical protein